MTTRQDRYKASSKGKAAQRKAIEKYHSSEKGQEALDRARAKHEQSEARKAYKREWMRKKRLAEKLATGSTQPDPHLSN